MLNRVMDNVDMSVVIKKMETMRRWKKRSANRESWISRYKFQVGLLHIFPLLKFTGGIGTRLWAFMCIHDLWHFQSMLYAEFINIRKRI